MSVCLVTIAIGEKYLNEYNRLFRPSQENYANKHGYDFRVITDFLDNDIRHHTTISFNKILVCSQDWSSKYDFVIFVDADILINPDSPAIHTCMDFGDNVGIVDEFTQPSLVKRYEFQRRMNWEQSCTIYYRRSGFNVLTDRMLNTGVLVMQPKKHASFLKNIYDKYIIRSINHHRHFNFEQSCIGYELLTNDMYAILPNQFNAIWCLYRYQAITLEAFSKNVYFIHFAGLAANNGMFNGNSINSLYKI